MKVLSFVAPIAFATGLAFALPALAQQAPAGSTGMCKDGTYTKAESKRGACRGHGGVKDWYATAGKATASEPKAEKSTAKREKSAKSEKSEKSTQSEPATTAPAAAAKPASKMASTSRPPQPRAEAAPGGRAGKVWVNTATNTYHCMNDRWYGKTKSGEYMSESAAKAKGAHASRGKACG